MHVGIDVTFMYTDFGGHQISLLDHGLYIVHGSERKIWPFLKVAISPKLKRTCPPKLVCMNVTSIPICMNFLSQF